MVCTLRDVLRRIKELILGQSVNKLSQVKDKADSFLIANIPQIKDPNHQREILRREAELTHGVNIS